jgi:ribosomal-protein-alanine N-acetyltransferase
MLRSELRTDAGVRSHPSLQTRRLVLREFAQGDALEVRRLAGAREIARMTLLIPHPYEDGMAEEWIVSLRPSYEAGEYRTFAVVLREVNSSVASG